MITQEKAQGVVEHFGDLAHEERKPRHHIADALESIGVTVSLHSDDVDCAAEDCAWIVNEAAALTGGKVTISHYRFEKDNPDDEDCGPGTMHFACNGKPLSISVEQQSNATSTWERRS
ncbi:hypothetical protein [Streptomyces sp. NPDC048638]|uniref:hypothetical protein n=1 Tax=Streptomyces sp. NPDC048638 TaxID=3365580 RepID=UPI00372160E3